MHAAAGRTEQQLTTGTVRPAVAGGLRSRATPDAAVHPAALRRLQVSMACALWLGGVDDVRKSRAAARCAALCGLCG